MSIKNSMAKNYQSRLTVFQIKGDILSIDNVHIMLEAQKEFQEIMRAYIQK